MPHFPVDARLTKTGQLLFEMSLKLFSEKFDSIFESCSQPYLKKTKISTTMQYATNVESSLKLICSGAQLTVGRNGCLLRVRTD